MLDEWPGLILYNISTWFILEAKAANTIILSAETEEKYICMHAKCLGILMDIGECNCSLILEEQLN